MPINTIYYATPYYNYPIPTHGRKIQPIASRFAIVPVAGAFALGFLTAPLIFKGNPYPYNYYPYNYYNQNNYYPNYY